MKKRLLLVVLLLLLLSTSLFADSELIAEIVDCQGTAYIRNGNDDPWKPLAIGDRLREGTEIYTDEDSCAELRVDTLSVRINPGTQFILQSLVKQGETLWLECQLISGAIWSKVVKIMDNLLHYKVITPTVVAGVEGTNFSIRCSPQVTEVLVAEGGVLLKTRDASDRQLILAEYEKARITIEGIFRVELQDSDDAEIDEMNQWGHTKEKNFEKSAKAGQLDQVKLGKSYGLEPEEKGRQGGMERQGGKGGAK